MSDAMAQLQLTFLLPSVRSFTTLLGQMRHSGMKGLSPTDQGAFIFSLVVRTSNTVSRSCSHCQFANYSQLSRLADFLMGGWREGIWSCKVWDADAFEV
jgi:hypothetical protein